MLARKALAGTAAAPKVYVEDVFSTWLYTGNGSTQTITNNIDLSTKGGMTWIKCRNAAGTNNAVFDTLRGATKRLFTDLTDAQDTSSTSLTAFTSSGFTLGANANQNNNGDTFASWTFRKAEKFFDVVTYTGNGSARTISHNLGSTPGCIIVKRTDTTGDWYVYHRSNTAAPETDYLLLNSTAATADLDTVWNDTSPTSTVFSVGTNTGVNANSGTYVAYLFAHDAGGFGDAGSDSIIKCGSYTGNGSATGPTITLDWEPQWVLVKRASGGTESWYLMDTMRGFTTDGNVTRLYPNDSLAEDASLVGPVIAPTATGFRILTSDASFNTNGNTYVYIAIRRGPMKTPTVGTSVFDAEINSTSSPRTWTPGFPVDLSILAYRNTVAAVGLTGTRLTGNSQYLTTSSTAAEDNAGSTAYQFDSTTGNLTEAILSNAASKVNWMFRRAPGFFDVVTYTGTGSAGATTSHNLGVSPELIITKVRNFSGEDWIVHYRNGSTITAGYLNTTAAFAASGSAPSTDLNSFSSTSYTRNTGNRRVNGSYNYVAYLFASLSGVSSIGTYTGNGSSVTVTTNFQPRFILVKRTDSTGNWIVSDSARGLVAGNDPYLLLNSTAAEDTDEDWVDITSTSFTVNETSASNANTNGGTYLYLAIA